MNAFPPELVTPPLPLVALLGVPAAADAVASHLRSGRRPPLTSVVAADAASASRLFPARKPAAADPDAVAGVFKADWYGKHRTRRPAVAAVLIARSDVDGGGAAAWASIAASLDAVKSAAARRGARVVVGVVGGGGAASPPPPLPDDRAAAVARAAGVPTAAVILFDPAEPADAGSRRFGDALYDAACAHYKADADRRKTAAAARDAARGGPPPPAAAARLHLKLGALAEFRGDWRAAVTAYVAAHAHLVAAVGGGEDDTPSPSLQRAAELAAVAEIAHLKAATLLLHQRRGTDAAALFSAHIRAFGGCARGTPPGETARAAAFAARQHAVMADLVASRDEGGQTPPDAARVRLVVDAARAAVAARRAAVVARRAAESTPPPPPVVPGAYVGQTVAPGPPPRRLTDAEFEAHAAATADPSPTASLAALTTARAAASAAGSAAARESASLAALAGRERVAAGDVAGGAADLAAAADVYRRERWHGPLARVLLDARDAAAKASPPDVAGGLAAGLEAASLEGGVGASARRDLQTAALQLAAGTTTPLTLPVDTSTGLASALGLWASADGRAAPAAASAHAAGAAAGFVGALWSHLPASLHLAGVTLEVTDGAGTCWVPACGVAGVDEAVAAAAPSPTPLPPARPLDLAPSAWTRFAAAWTPRAPGAAHVAAIHAWMTPTVCLTWRVAADVTTTQPPYVGRPPPPLTRPPWPRAALSPTGWALDVAPAGGRPRVTLRAPAVVLAGERAPIVVSVAAAAAPLSGGVVTLAASDNGDVFGEDGSPTTSIPLPDTSAGGTAAVAAFVCWRGAGRRTLTATLTHTEAGARVAPSHDVLTAAFDVAPALDVERVEGCGPPGFAALHDENESAPPATPSSPGPPPDPPLPTGQDCVLAITLAARAGLEVTALALDPAPGVARPSGDAVAVPARLSTGDALTALFRIRRDTPVEAASPGVLNVTWRRAGGVKLVVVAGEAGGTEGDAAPSTTTTTTTSLPLPALSFSHPLLSAHTHWPPRVTAGAPLPLTLTLTARAATPGARVGVAVADGHGFVVGGRRRAWVDVLPGRSVVETLTLVPHAAGALALPAVTLTVDGGGAALDATAGGVVVVEPCVV